MIPNIPMPAFPPSAYMNEASHLLEGLEALRGELGSIAEELIVLLRNAGVTPPQSYPMWLH